MSSLADIEHNRKTLAEAQKQGVERLLSEFGITPSNELSELISDACASEGLTFYTIQEWLSSQGNRPVYPKTKEIYQIILEHKTGANV